MNKIKCNICDKEYSVKGIHTHKIRMHGTDEQKAVFIRVECKDSANNKNHLKYKANVTAYNLDPTKCKQCSLPLIYKRRFEKFCNKSCAATFNNLARSGDVKRGPDKGYVFPDKNGTERVKKSTVTSTIEAKKNNIPHSILYRCICKHCGIVWLNKVARQYCAEHVDLYSHNGRARYWFSFSISAYPDLFDGKLIKKNGMRSMDNPNGVTRDHRVSVNESIKNNYDPYYIKHPINCELMLFKDNAKKNTNSSITYKELIILVDTYDKEKAQ